MLHGGPLPLPHISQKHLDNTSNFAQIMNTWDDSILILSDIVRSCLILTLTGQVKSVIDSW